MFSLSDIKHHNMQKEKEYQVDGLALELGLAQSAALAAATQIEEKERALERERELARAKAELESKIKELGDWEQEVEKYRGALNRKEKEVLESRRNARYFNVLLKRLVCTRFCMSFMARKRLKALHMNMAKLIVEIAASKLDVERKRRVSVVEKKLFRKQKTRQLAKLLTPKDSLMTCVGVLEADVEDLRRPFLEARKEVADW